MLNIVKYHVKEEGLRYSEITGCMVFSILVYLIQTLNPIF